MSRRTHVWTLVALLAAANVIAYVDRTNLSFALAADEFRRLFSLSNQDRGNLNSAFFWTYALLQIPAGAVADRFGVKYPFAIGLLVWSIVSAATGFATSLSQIFIFRLLLGVGEAILTPGALKWVRLHVAEKQRGAAVGLFFAGAKFGPAVGAALSVWLMNLYGWRGMFFVLGIGSLVWLVPWLLLADDDRAPQVEAESHPATFASVFASPAIYGIIIATFAYNYFNYFCMTWLPAYFVDRWRMSLEASGAFTAFSFGGFAAVAIVAGVVADALIARGAPVVATRKAFAVSGLVLAALAALGALTDSPRIALAAAVVSLTALGLTTANYWALTQTIMPAAAIGRITGVQNFASNLSGIVASILTGWLVTWTGSYKTPILACSALLAVGAIAYALLVRERFTPSEGIHEEEHRRRRAAVVSGQLRPQQPAD